jgi:hypothetical protein
VREKPTKLFGQAIEEERRYCFAEQLKAGNDFPLQFALFHA